jgi:hypothetical protein
MMPDELLGHPGSAVDSVGSEARDGEERVRIAAMREPVNR